MSGCASASRHQDSTTGCVSISLTNFSSITHVLNNYKLLAAASTAPPRHSPTFHNTWKEDRDSNKNPNIPSKQSNAYRANILVKTKTNHLRSFIPSTVRVRRVPPFIHLIQFLPHTIIAFQSYVLFIAIKVLRMCFSVFKPFAFTRT